MTKKALFESVFDLSKQLSAEYSDYIDFCGRKKGVVYTKPKDKMEHRLGLLLYALKRHIVAGHEEVKIPPKKERKKKHKEG